ncbi:hypothetical protein M408DRAFT_28880 [Serendipita vermifera MAFF 305830]|uniref:Uncharacterized protein n=1 Tax=Serendipita vermifera MAFF 305830 TaxID=933852 RepID=A0A0C2WY54_SERVB|nr:hypothetical protein M408DRAFT_28880 [Serendipita vermifera MAFF 305830]
MQDTLPKSVRFEELEVVDFERPTIGFAFHFPAVRHAAFGHLYGSNTLELKDIPQLESLLLGGIQCSTAFDWETVPNLRFLGAPTREMGELPPLPIKHPLRHLYVHIHTVPRDDHNGYPNRDAEQSQWINETIEHFPSITRLTLSFTRGVPWIGGHFKDEDCELLGLQMQSCFNKCNSITQHIVYNRDPIIAKPVAKEPEPQTPEKTDDQHKGLQARWNRFYQSTLRKFHL